MPDIGIQHLLQQCNGFISLILAHQDGSSQCLCIGIRRLSRQCLIGLLSGLVYFPCQHIKASQMDTRIDQLGIQLNGLAIVTKGPAPLLFSLLDLAQIEIRCRCLWINLQHILELDTGLVVVLFFEIGLATLHILRLALLGTTATGQHENNKQNCHH